MAQILSPPTAAGVLLRHDMMPDRTGWTVYDALESRPVRLGGIILAGLGFEEADDLVRVLNGQELEIQREARRRVLAAAPRGPALPTAPRVREAARARP
jgi:hypothetical protein